MSIQPLSSGMWRLREVQTIDNQAELEVSLGDSKCVKIIIDQLRPSTDTRLCFVQFSDDNRSTYKTSAAYKHREDVYDSANTNRSAFQSASDGVVRIMNGSRLGNATGENYNYELTVFGHTNSSAATTMLFHGFGVDNNGNASRIEGSASCIYDSSQNTATDIKVYVDSGNLASGNVYVYELIS